MTSVPAKWAILIAIDFYVDSDQRLEGCVNDISDIDLWLKQNFDPINITKFTAANTGDPNQKLPLEPATAWPTYENITQRLREVTETANPGDFIHVHYSGHGALRPTTNAAYKEKDGSDAALVLFDVDNEVCYLRGIELASLFDDIVKKQLKLTVVLDCCHAGSITRKELSAYSRIRGVLWDPLKATTSLNTASAKAHSLVSAGRAYRDAETNQHWLLHPQGYTLIAACGPNEIAGECRGEDGKNYGALSYFLLMILVSALDDGLIITFASVYRQLRAKLHVRFPLQHPMLLGNTSATFLNMQIAKRTFHSVCNVVRAAGIDQIWLGVGHAHGICIGDEFAIHSTDLQTNEVMRDNKKLSKIVIITVQALQSQAKLIYSPPEGAIIRAGWYATLTSRSRLKAQIVLFDGAGEEWREAVERSIWLQLFDPSRAPLIAPTLRIRTTERDVFNILDGSGQVISNLPSMSLDGEHAVHQVIATLEHLAKFVSIESLENSSNNSLVNGKEFSVEFQPESKMEPDIEGNKFSIEEGARVEVVFKNHTNMPLNLTVLNLRPLRQVKRILPGSDRGDWKVVQTKGRMDNIDYSGVTTFRPRMSIPSKIKANGSSEIEDVFKFFVTTRPSSFDILELPELDEKALRLTRTSESTMLYDLLQNLTVGHRTSEILRGESSQGEKWGCCNFIISTRCKNN